MLREAQVPLSNFVVNFGAADGACGGRGDWNADPANCLANGGAAGLMLEGNPRWRPELLRRFGDRRNVTLGLDYVRLDEVAGLLRGHLARPEASEAPDLLKMDIDHADCRFMAEALRIIRPRLIHFEYWPLLPPPMDYAQHYQPTILEVGLYRTPKPLLVGGTGSGVGGEPAGCSLAGFLSRAPGYELLAVGAEEALLVQADLLSVLRRSGLEPPRDATDGWVRGALCHPLHGHAPGTFQWGFDFRGLSEPSVPLAERSARLRDVLAEHGAFGFDLQ